MVWVASRNQSLQWCNYRLLLYLDRSSCKLRGIDVPCNNTTVCNALNIQLSTVLEYDKKYTFLVLYVGRPGVLVVTLECYY